MLATYFALLLVEYVARLCHSEPSCFSRPFCFELPVLELQPSFPMTTLPTWKKHGRKWNPWITVAWFWFWLDWLCLSFLSLTQTVPQGWSTAYFIALFVTESDICILFSVYESYIPRKPLILMSIGKYPGLVSAWLLLPLAGWALVELPFTIWRYTFKSLRRPAFSNSALSGTCVNIIVAFVLHRVRGTLLMIIGIAGFTTAALIYSFMLLHALYSRWPFSAMIRSVLARLVLQCRLASVSKELQSTAGSLLNTNMQLSIALALTISSAIVGAVVPNQKSSTNRELLKGYRRAFYFEVGLSCLGLMLSFFLRDGRRGGKNDKEYCRTRSSRKGSDWYGLEII